MTDTTIQPLIDEPFGPSAAVPPQIALQLQALVAEAVAPLLERIAALEATISDLKAAARPCGAGVHRVWAPGATNAEKAQSPQPSPPEPESVLLEEIFHLRADLEEHNEARALEIAQDRRRIAALEVPVVRAPTAKTLAHLDRLDREMRGSQIKQLSFTNAARLLGLSSSRIRQLKPLILEDRRFVIVKDPHHSQRLLIRTNFRR